MTAPEGDPPPERDYRPYCAVCERRIEKRDWAEHHEHIVTSQEAARLGAIVDENIRLTNALQWIRMQAGMHYYGGAFEPEHMRSLANLAADALSGLGHIADFETVMNEAKEYAADLAERLNRHIDTGETDD